MNFTGGPVENSDGGCLTGENTRSVAIGNVLENCVHAFGYKGDARPVLLNNTIVDCDEGFRVLDDVQVRAVGNLFFENGVDLMGSAAAAASYMLEARSNLFDIPAFADGNLSGDPLFEAIGDFAYGLAASSPALDQVEYDDLEALLVDSPFSPEEVMQYLSTDFLGNPRPYPVLDVGAVERR
jgi:hypothetical protein